MAALSCCASPVTSTATGRAGRLDGEADGTGRRLAVFGSGPVRIGLLTHSSAMGSVARPLHVVVLLVPDLDPLAVLLLAAVVGHCVLLLETGRGFVVRCF